MKAVIFDVDGTLIKIRKELFFEAFKFIRNELGYGDCSTENIERFIQGDKEMSRNVMIERVFGFNHDNFAELFKSYMSDFEKVKRFKSLYPDVKFVLDELRRGKVIMGAVTDAPPFIAIPQRNYFLGNGYFSEFVITYKSDLRDKPAPDGLLYCMKQLGVEEAVFVGDSDSDIIAAQSAGIPAIWIDRGEHEIHTEPNRRIKTCMNYYDNK